MKHIATTLLILFALNAQAQETQPDSAASEAVSSTENADYHYGQSGSASTAVPKEKIIYRRAFQVKNANDAKDVYTRALTFARTMSTKFKEDKRSNTIKIPVTWGYHGASNECIEELMLEGEITVEIKGTKTRLTLSDISYTHHDRGDNTVKGVAKSDIISRKPDCAPSKGKVEGLYNCGVCKQSLSHLTSALSTQFDVFARQYQDALRWY
jgi:hypothetical protein